MDFEQIIAALNDYIIVASVIVIAIRNSINCAALTYNCSINKLILSNLNFRLVTLSIFALNVKIVPNEAKADSTAMSKKNNTQHWWFIHERVSSVLNESVEWEIQWLVSDSISLDTTNWRNNIT